MNKILKIWVVQLPLWILLGCTTNEPSTTSPSTTVTQMTEKEAFILHKKQVSKTLRIPAELHSYERTKIQAKLNAFVKNVSVDLGDVVAKGATLLILEAPETNAQYREALAHQEEVRAKLIASQDHYRRLKNAASQEGVISPMELVAAQNRMLADSAVLISSQATIEMYRELLNYLVIRAPFKGTITSRSVDPGDLVGPGTGMTSLLTLERTDRLRLQVAVPESYVLSIPEADQIPFYTDAMTEGYLIAKLSRKSGRIDPETRTELWEFDYDNSSKSLKPGMFCMAELSLARSSPSLVVPHTTLVTTLEKRFVVRIRNNQADWVDVNKGLVTENMIEIFGDLMEGDTLLTRGTEEIKPGSQIRVKIQ